VRDQGFLERLLDGAAVEWLPLGDEGFFCIANNKRKPVKSSLRVAGRTPYYGANNIQDYVDGHTHEGEYVLIAEDGSASLENYSIQYATGRFWANNHVHVVRGKGHVNTRYLFHFLRTVNFQPYLSGGGRAKLTKGRLTEIPVAVPCPDEPGKSLAIQREIVRILDSFTELTAELAAELTAELAARKKQYKHFRSQLLSFEGCPVSWKALGDIGSFTYGLAAKAKNEGAARFIRISDINSDGKLSAENPKFVDVNEESQKYFLRKFDILMARTGATYGKTMIYESYHPAIFAGFLIKLDLRPDIIHPKYYWHFAQSDFFWDQANALVSGGGQPQFNANALQRLKVLLPFPDDPKRSLLEQERVVSILDKLEALTSSLSEGLPREITLRKQQYEYYRDQLLGFPKPAEAVDA
jgi:type I restriction enzyme S subunit